MKRFILSFFLVLFYINTSLPAIVDTLSVYSTSMDKEIKSVIVKPESYKGNKSLPVLYLLHGYSDSYDVWIKKTTSLKELADIHEMFIVCPDGGYDSWYWDSPIDPSYQYETFVCEELVEWIDNNYNTIDSREGRAITGLSMGGHGGLYLGFRNQDVYGACGSMSGGVDIRPFPNNWGMKKYIGAQAENPENWNNYTVMGMLHLLTPGDMKIVIDCGKDDFFYEVNEELHRALLYRNIPHDYIIRPGVHNWDYWANAIKFQVLFFNEYFTSYNQ